MAKLLPLRISVNQILSAALSLVPLASSEALRVAADRLIFLWRRSFQRRFFTCDANSYPENLDPQPEHPVMTKKCMTVNRYCVALAIIILGAPQFARAQSVTIEIGDAYYEEVASISSALERVAALRSERPEAAITLRLAAQTYWLDAPIILTPAHSGVPNKPLRIVGSVKNGSATRVSGGLSIEDWRVEDGVWVTDWYARAGGPIALSAIWVNGEFRGPARSPNEGYFHTAGKAPDIVDANGNRVSRSKTAFKFAPGDIQPWPDMAQAVIRTMHSWDVSNNRIAKLEARAHIANFKMPVSWAFERWGQNQRYIVQHVRDAFDAPGEWYLDQRTGLLYYRPRKGETPESVEVVAPRLGSILLFRGDLAKGAFVEHVLVENLVIAHTNLPIPEHGLRSSQAAHPATGAVQGWGARHVTLRHCEITQTSNYGVWFSAGSKYNRIEQCRIHHLGAGGIRFGHMSEGDTEAEHAGHNTAVHNDISDGGYVYPEGVGVWIGRSSSNRVAHNAIHDFYYTGVSVGWSWGYRKSTANHNIIEYNHIHDIGKGVLSDMGGIYLLGKSPATIVRNNIIHDIESYNYGGWGLYTDEGSSDLLIENNIVYRTKTGGFHQHYGRDNLIQNNILAFSRMAQIMRTREEEHISFYFDRNIIYFANTQTLGSNWGNGNFVMDRNLYFSTAAKPIQFNGMTFREWQAKGHDRNSRIADPLFQAPERGDFTLARNSPALKIGFRPIDTTSVGPQRVIGPSMR